MENKLFYTLTPEGNEVLRDLKKENETFNMEDYITGKFDGNNYMWYEMFDHYVYDDLGCDYERYGCYIREGDVVLDLGANIGIFAHRAELRGASRVVSFEPVTPTFSCLIKNKGPKTEVYKNSVGRKNGHLIFEIHTDFTHIGGGTSNKKITEGNNKDVVHTEISITVGINEIFEMLEKKVDFLKVDIEGGELDVLSSISDENLSVLRCLSSEFHILDKTYEKFQDFFIERMDKLGFNYFVLHHGDGFLRTITFWKR